MIDETEKTPSSRRSTRRTVRHWLVGVAGVIALLLVVQNQEPVHTRFLFWSAEMPRFLLLVLIYLLGAVSGWIVRWRGGR